MKIHTIIKNPTIEKYLQKRQLTKQYLKAEQYILSGNIYTVKLKLREPKKDAIYYFRINRQYRALCKIIGGTLVILEISNHQEN